MSRFKDILKNIPGARIKRRLVAFYVDDWGSVRSRDKEAVENMRAKGIDVDKSRFTRYDSLASATDLSMLFDVLRSVKDSKGNCACFTAVTNPCNPDFEAIRANGFTKFVSEPFTTTLKKYRFDNAFPLWQQGIAEGIFYPIFHGTEHQSRKQLMRALQQGHRPDVIAFENDCTGVPTSLRGLMQPYYIESVKDNEALALSIEQGLNEFKNIFGRRARQFRAGGDVISPDLYPVLKRCGIEYMDETFYVNRYYGDGKHKRCFSYTGKTNSIGHKLLVRNCFFEPSAVAYYDSVERCIELMDAAFLCGKPAIISSHRANFVGEIDADNRKRGLEKLSRLLDEIVKRYPNVEFVNADCLGDIIFKV